MKIGIEVQRLFREQKFGIETSALQMIKQLLKQNPKTEFVVYAKDDKDKSCLQHASNLVVKTLTGKLFFDFEHFFLPIAAKKDRVDLLHCTGNTTPFSTSVPIVQTLHDVIFMDPIPSKDTMYQRFGNHYRRHLVPLVTPKSSAVITVSNYEKERILNRINLDERKIRVIYNGIDEQRFRIEKNETKFQEVRSRYKLPEKFILFLGNTSERKNSKGVIEAYSLYASRNSKPMPIVTPGLPEEYIAAELKKLGQEDKQNLFHSPGYIRNEDLATLYNLTTIFLFPSLSEGFGLPLVEAMACGCPVITSGTSCLPEIAGGAALLVDPKNASSIAAAIEQFLKDENLRLQKVREGLTNASKFSWDRTAQQVFEVYEEVYYNTKSVGQPSAKVTYELQ